MTSKYEITSAIDDGDGWTSYTAEPTEEAKAHDAHPDWRPPADLEDYGRRLRAVERELFRAMEEAGRGKPQEVP